MPPVTRLRLSDDERYYLEAILVSMRKFKALVDASASVAALVGREKLTDEIDWLNGFLTERRRARRGNQA